MLSLKKFYSSFRCPSSSGVNAFCHSWDRENAWICPPVNKILQVVRKIKLTNGTGVLIVPKWSSARFWPFLVGPTGQVREPFRTMVEFRPIIIQNQQARSALSGETIFAMLALVNWSSCCFTDVIFATVSKYINSRNVIVYWTVNSWISLESFLSAQLLSHNFTRWQYNMGSSQRRITKTVGWLG